MSHSSYYNQFKALAVLHLFVCLFYANKMLDMGNRSKLMDSGTVMPLRTELGDEGIVCLW